MRLHRFYGGLALLAAALCTSTPAQQSADLLDVQGGQIRVVTVAEGLLHPWSIALLPGDRAMLVAERGRIRLIESGALVAEPVWSAEGFAAGNELKWLTLHPRFESNRLVYLSYAKSGEGGMTTLAVARGRFDGRKLQDVRDIFVADAWETGGNMAGKLLFGPDETLYVTVGDRDRLCCTGTEDNSLRMKRRA
jgi:glucose/arabinose dehydrogenase